MFYDLKMSLSTYQVNCARDKLKYQAATTQMLLFDLTSLVQNKLFWRKMIENRPKPAKININAEYDIWSFRIIRSHHCG